MRRVAPWSAAVAWLLGFALPVLESPTASDPVAPTRLLVLGAAIAVGALAQPTGGLPRTVAWVLAAGWGVLVLAALAGPTPVMSLLGRYPRYEGALVVAGYAICVALGARLFAHDRRARTHLERALAASSIVSLLIALVQVTTASEQRVIATLGNSSTLGVWGVLVACVLGWGLWEQRSWWRWAGAAAGLSLVVVSASRAAQVAAIVVCAAALVLGLTTKPRRGWWVPIATAAMVVAGVLLVPTARARVTGGTPFAEATISGRTQLWQESVDLIVSHPWLGAGPSRFVDSIGAFHTADWAANVGPYAPPDSPHNVVLQVGSATGVVGLLVTAILAVLWARSWWPGRGDVSRQAAALAALGCATAYLAGFTDPITTPMVCLLSGLAVGASLPSDAKAPTVGVRAAITGLFVLVIGWFAGTIAASEWTFSSALATDSGHVELLHTASAQRPWDPDFRRRVAFTHARLVEEGLADPDEALASAAGLCEPLPGSVECLQVLADLQDLAGHPTGALTTLGAARSLDSTNVDTILRQGIAHARAGDLPAAERAFLDAATLRPMSPEPWDNLAQLYRLQGRTQDAEDARATAESLR